MKTITAEEFKSKYGESGVAALPPVKSQAPENTGGGLIDRIKDRLMTRAGGIAERIDQGQGFGSTLLQGFGQGAGLGGDIIAETVNTVTGGAIPKVLNKTAELVPDFIANAGADAILAYQDWKGKNPEAAANVESLTNIISVAPVGVGAKAGVNTATDIATGAARTAGTAVDAVAGAVKPVVTTAGNIATGVKDIGVLAAEGASRIPSRIATNVAEKAATREIINQLPTQIAKTAARDGIDVADVKSIYSIAPEQKPIARNLVKATQDFANGTSKTNPIEVVGKPIVDRIKLLNKERGRIGQKLGEVANSLPSVSSDELVTPVLQRLQSVPGLSGIKLVDGKLDFTDTVLATSATKSDRAAIQQVFDDAIKAGTGKQKHLLRQELFEVIGGKKNAGKAITETQDKAFDAIRGGLSDVLETKNSTYKNLSSQYREVITPLNDIRKFMKSIGAADEDILNMQAGLLARRLTSNAASNPQIRNILRAMDNASSIKGQSSVSVEFLQDFYNILEKYYDIAGKTGFQGQVTSGVSKVSGVKDFISQSVGDLAGKTPAVQRKALEDALAEALTD